MTTPDSRPTASANDANALAGAVPFTMTLIAVALDTGLLLSNVVVPPCKAL